jgi:hypothetical protein
MNQTPSDAAITVRRLLAQVRRRHRWRRLGRGACAGLLAGTVARVALVAVSWCGDWRPTAAWLAGAWLLGPLAGAALALARRDSWRDAAAAVDRHRALRDRTITALELLSRPPTPLAELQIADTAARLAGIKAADVVGRRMPRLLPYAAAACYFSAWLPVCPTTARLPRTVAASDRAATEHHRRASSARDQRPRAPHIPAAAVTQPRAARRPPAAERVKSQPSRSQSHSSDANRVTPASAKLAKKSADADALSAVANELDLGTLFTSTESVKSVRAGSDAAGTFGGTSTLAVRLGETPTSDAGNGVDLGLSSGRTAKDLGASRPSNAMRQPIAGPSPLWASDSHQPLPTTGKQPQPPSGETQLGQPAGDHLHPAAESTQSSSPASNTSAADSQNALESDNHLPADGHSPAAKQPKASATKSNLPARPVGQRSNITHDGTKLPETKPAKEPPATHSSPSKPAPSQGRGMGLSFSPAGGYSGPNGNKSSESHSNGTGGRGGPGGKGGTGPAGGGRLPRRDGTPRPATDDGFLQSDRPADAYQLVEPRDDSPGSRASELWPSASGPLELPMPAADPDVATSELDRDDLPRAGLPLSRATRQGNSPFDSIANGHERTNAPHHQPTNSAGLSLPLTGGRSASAPVRVETWRASEAWQPARRTWQAIEYEARPITEAPPVIEEIPAEQRATIRRYFEAIRRDVP